MSDITDSTAVAEMLIENYGERKGLLKLRFERDDWYVDDFIGFYPFDAEGNLAQYSELEELQDFVKEGLEIREKAKTLAGDWGWVGKDVPEIWFHLEMTDKGLECTECVEYRIHNFGDMLVTYDGVHLTIDNFEGYADYSAREIHLYLSQDKNGDLVGNCEVDHEHRHDCYDGEIRLRKGYFMYEH